MQAIGHLAPCREPELKFPGLWGNLRRNAGGSGGSFRCREPAATYRVPARRDAFQSGQFRAAVEWRHVSLGEKPMQYPMRCAESLRTSAIKPHWFLVAIALLLEPSGVFAQAGSAGGTVGVQEKSTSGGQEREARPRPSKRVSRAPASEGRAAASIDGTWAVSATGRCVPPWQLTFLINNGVISGSGAAGQVSRGGSASGHVLVLALRFDFIGHFGGRQASGTFTGADGCPGTWSATKS
jgi:hypothetical protein